MTNELIADGIYRVSGMETSLKNGAWVSDAGTYLVTNQTKLADIPDARPGDIAFTAGYGHIWQLDVDGTTWVELPKTAAGTAASQAAASATAAAGSASAAAASASQAQTVAASIPADYTSLSNSVVDLKSALDDTENAIGSENNIINVDITPVSGHRYYYDYPNPGFNDISDVGMTYFSTILNVQAGQIYYYSGRVYNYDKQYSVIVTDDNNTVLLYDLGYTSDTNVVDYQFTIPQNGTKLYITSYKSDSDPLTSALALKMLKKQLFHVNRITEEIGGVIPEYYTANDWLQSKMKNINDKCGFINGVVFPFITDVHFANNAGNSKFLLREILEKTACSFVIGGGDYQGGFGGAEDLSAQFKAMFDFTGYVGHDRFFSVAGNHDFYEQESIGSSTRINATYGEVYNAIFRPSERWQRERMPGGYYCIDIDSQKTRFIMLNSHEPSPVASGTEIDGLIRVRPEQIQWLISALTEKTGYRIIVISHATSDPDMPDYSATIENVQKVLVAYANHTTDTIRFTDTWSVNVDFTNAQNTIICHINGHSHVDASHVDRNVLSICTTCDACLQDDGYGAVMGTVTEQAFDVFCIDYDAMTIKAVRVGRGSNRAWAYVNEAWQIVN